MSKKRGQCVFPYLHYQGIKKLSHSHCGDVKDETTPIYGLNTNPNKRRGQQLCAKVQPAVCPGIGCHIVISSLIRPRHLLGLCLTLEGKSDTEGCGRQLGGGERKEMCTTPLPSKNIYIIDEAWLFAGRDGEHADLARTQVKQTGNWQCCMK